MPILAEGDIQEILETKITKIPNTTRLLFPFTTFIERRSGDAISQITFAVIIFVAICVIKIARTMLIATITLASTPSIRGRSVVKSHADIPVSGLLTKPDTTSIPAVKIYASHGAFLRLSLHENTGFLFI